MNSTDNILLYQAPGGQTQLEVQLDHETVWLTQAQMAELFGRDQGVISRHLKNIFATGELQEETSVQKMHIALVTSGNESDDGFMQKMHKTSGGRPVSYYNLDAIISVGYRVNSIKGTQFRQWATNVLRQYLVQGYALNEKRLRESTRQLADLKRLVQLQAEVAANQELISNESNALLRVLGDYARALDVLDQYDHQRLSVRGTATEEFFELTYEAGLEAVESLRKQFGGSPLLDEKKTLHSKALYEPSTKALTAKTCTRAWKKRPLTYSISW